MDFEVPVDGDVQYLVHTVKLCVCGIHDHDWLVFTSQLHDSNTYQEWRVPATSEFHSGVCVFFVCVNLFHETDFYLASVVVDSGDCLRELQILERLAHAESDVVHLVKAELLEHKQVNVQKPGKLALEYL